MSDSRALEAVRADRWLWAARFFKSRALAAEACAGGKVDVNNQVAKPARSVRAGDLVRVTLPGGKRIVRVEGLSERRGPGAAARALYTDLTPAAPPRAVSPLPRLRPVGVGRPTKRDRRRIQRLRDGLAMLNLVGALATDAWAQGDRPTEADISACVRVARELIESPSYVEGAPISPFPVEFSGVAPYSGPIVGVEGQVSAAQSSIAAADSPATSGLFGAGGFSQESEIEFGAVDPRLKETFEACMRARIGGASAAPSEPTPPEDRAGEDRARTE